ncbi:MAG: cytosine/adenosine deaminase-related metal-dependent hydrolase, partial [Myxococcota bacterium]
DALIRAAASPGPAPSSIHLAETGAERVFLETGGGAFAELLDRLGVDASAFTAPACGPVAYLRRLGVLRPDVLLVHGVDLSPGEWREVAAAGAPVCLCPRSNLYIGGVLPDVGAAFASGARLCLGTDSLASNDDLDILGELPVLIEAFPDVPAGRWLDLATAGGADALGLPLGRLQPGLAPGLVLLRGVTHPDDLATVPARSVVLPAEMP